MSGSIMKVTRFFPFVIRTSSKKGSAFVLPSCISSPIISLDLYRDRKRFNRKIPPAAPAVRSALATIVARYDVFKHMIMKLVIVET
jgi:hypothetical protein